METKLKETDLYAILMGYANKNNSPYIKMNTFLSFLGSYAQKMAEKNSEWFKWTSEREVKFWSELSALAESGECELLTDTPEGRIFMPHFFTARLRHYYKNIEKNAELPFPNAESLKHEIPESLVLPADAGSGLIHLVENPQKKNLPIIRINFPDDFGNILLLADFIPQRLTEFCLIKVSNYLKARGNKDYVYYKLSSLLGGKEVQLRNILDLIHNKPLECYGPFAGGRDFHCLFWSHFSIFVKDDIKETKELHSEYIGAAQAVYIIESLSSFFRIKEVKNTEKELAFNELEIQLKKLPYLYNLGDIIKFTNSQKTPLLKFYSNGELETALKKLASESENNQLPELLVINENNDTWFVAKSKLFLLCARMLIEARDKINGRIVKRWAMFMEEYDKEPAMEKDEHFEILLEQYAKKYFPLLTNILTNPVLPIIFDEMEQSGNEIPLTARIISEGKLLPYSQVFLLKRKDILYTAMLQMPFWYSVPFLRAIISFFIKKPKEKSQSKEDSSSDDSEIKTYDEAASAAAEAAAEKKKLIERRNAASLVSAALVPAGSTLEVYMKELEKKWVRLLDEKARDDLVHDVQALARDKLKKALRLKRAYKITHENLSELAENIVEYNNALKSIGKDESIKKYVELYLIKLLLSH